MIKIGSVIICIYLFCGVFVNAGEKVELLCSFEDDSDLDAFISDGESEIVNQHATEGSSALKVVYKADRKECRFLSQSEKFKSAFTTDWSEYSTFAVDVFNESETESFLNIRIKSTDHQKIWQRQFKIPSQKVHTIKIDIKELKSKIEVDDVMYLGLTMGKSQYDPNAKPITRDCTLYFDNIRLIK